MQTVFCALSFNLFSAGIGRSGSYLLIESMRRHILVSDSLNIDGHLRHIRKQRAKLVQTLVLFKIILRSNYYPTI